MNKTIFILAVVLALSACQGGAGSGSEIAEDAKPTIQIAPENLITINFDIEGMTCAGCEGAVVSSLKNIEGVAEAAASHQTGKAVVKYDKTLVTEKAMEEAIGSRGYTVSGHTHGE
jgi:mercuric ion transport protein